jgi:hypothetical protein
MQALQRLAQSEDIAGAIALLASPKRPLDNRRRAARAELGLWVLDLIFCFTLLPTTSANGGLK